jgi:tRNA threonylcarbamoyladenosine biosynthesis protein TsaB
MSLILNIDTALSSASVCIAKDGEAFKLATNHDQKDHAAWLLPAIKEALNDLHATINDLDAVAVSIGPGSYTGLRVGLSTAKGLCYALSKPLITVNTLEIMAFSVKDEAEEYIVPLIDARRLEVYTAIYDKQIREKISTHTLIVEPGIFSDLLSSHKIIFCGDGLKKLLPFIDHPHATCSNTSANAGHLAVISQLNFVKNQFADVAYATPLYVKDFHSTQR